MTFGLFIELYGEPISGEGFSFSLPNGIYSIEPRNGVPTVTKFIPDDPNLPTICERETVN